MGDYVTGVIPASTFGLLPAPPEVSPSTHAKHLLRPLTSKADNVLDRRERRDASSGTPTEEVREGTKHFGTRKSAVGEAVSSPRTMVLENVLHLFKHGTPLSLELELNKFGKEELRALRTPDVSNREYRLRCQYPRFIVV